MYVGDKNICIINVVVEAMEWVFPWKVCRNMKRGIRSLEIVTFKG